MLKTSRLAFTLLTVSCFLIGTAQALQETEPSLDSQLDELLEVSGNRTLAELLEALGPAPALDEILEPLPEGRIPLMHMRRGEGGELFRLDLTEIHQALAERDAEVMLKQSQALLDGLLELGENHPLVADAKDLVLTAQSAMRDPETFEVLQEFEELSAVWNAGEQSLQTFVDAMLRGRRIFGATRLDLHVLQSSLAVTVFYSNDVARAESLAVDACFLLIEQAGLEHRKTTTAIVNLAFLLLSRRSFAASEALFAHALDTDRKLDPPTTSAYERTLFNLGQLYRDTDRSEEALRIFERVLELRVLNEVGPGKIGMVYAQMGNVLRQMGRGAEARTALEEGLRLLEEGFPGDNHECAQALINLGIVERVAGRFDRATELGEQAVAMYERMFPGGHLNTALTRKTLAQLYQALGALADAERHVRRSEELFAQYVPESHAYRLESRMVFASVLLAKGDTAEARELLEQGLQVRKQIFGERTWVVASDLGDLALAARELGDLDAAQEYVREETDILTEVVGANHRRTQAARVRWADLLLESGETEEGVKQLKLALDGLSANPNETPTILAEARFLWAEHLNASGQTLLAISEYQSALEALRVNFAAPPLIVKAELSLGAALMSVARPRLASEAFTRALDVCERTRTEVLGDERARATYAKQLSLKEVSCLAVMACVSAEDPAGALRAAERGRSRALLDLFSRAGADLVELAQTNQGDLSERLKRLMADEDAARAQLLESERSLAKLRSRGQADSDQGWQGLERVTELRKELRGRETEVLSAMGSAFPSTQTAAPERIGAALQSDEILLHFTWHQQAVTLIQVTREQIKVRSLAKGEEVAKLEGQLLAHLESLRSGVALNSESLSALSQALLPKEVAAALQASGHAVIVPDGPLHGLPFETLQLQGADWLGSGPTTSYVPSGSVLVELRTRARVVKGGSLPARAVVLGNPSFGEPASEGSDATRSAVAPASSVATQPQPSELDTVRLFGASLAPLPATRAEVQRVAQCLQGANYESVELTKDKATQEQLEKHARDASVLHLATHGFRADPERPYEAALALTPGALSEPRNDGFLILDELVRHWGGRLSNCELVTLSACDTNVGAKLGTSLVSLYWGFFHAGARSVVVSLWKVDDRATLLLMDRFYTNWAGQFQTARSVGKRSFQPGERLPAGEALLEARAWLATQTPDQNRQRLGELNALIESGSRAGQDTFALPGAKPTEKELSVDFDFSHPRYWAPFVLYGGGQR